MFCEDGRDNIIATHSPVEVHVLIDSGYFSLPLDMKVLCCSMEIGLISDVFKWATLLKAVYISK